ncbi:TetR/AcrR family transcriptional regulator [Catenuloplanes sp. NPDC051500]|uniref:TetR/AcrR family transcriptional regulator n=1 Tax=Catenuloplanes sp. NPDC051500 TaxID=3363959 RepID=UPI0037BBF49F
MSAQERRERERALRERLIITTARDLAEAEGWDAVTTRRLAELIEYSQPVLYSHFKGKDAIMAAVAVEGFAEIATHLHGARDGASTPQAALAAVVSAYADFAERRPALYDAMFVRTVGLRFDHPETPVALRDAFGALRGALQPFAGPHDLDDLTELLWSGLHGLVTLTGGGRLPGERHERRLALLAAQFAGRAVS